MYWALKIWVRSGRIKNSVFSLWLNLFLTIINHLFTNTYKTLKWLVGLLSLTGSWRAIAEYDRIGNNWFGIWLSSAGNFHFRVGSDTKNSTQTLSPDKWYLLTATYDSLTSRIKLYINGQFDSSHTHSTGFTAPVASKLTIGTRGSEDAEYFDGRIDDVRIYNIAMDAAEVLALFNE